MNKVLGLILILGLAYSVTAAPAPGIFDFVTNGISYVSNTITGVLNAISNIFSSAALVLTNATQQTTNTAINLVKIKSQSTIAAVNAVQELLQNIEADVSDEVKGLVQDFKAQLAVFPDMVGAALGDGMVKVVDGINKLAQEVNVEEVIESIEKIVDDINKAIDLENLKDLTEKLEADLQELYNSLQTATKDATDDVKAIANNIFATASGIAAAAVDTLRESVEKISNVSSDFATGIKNLISQASSAASTLFNDVKNAATTARTKLTEAITAAKDDVVDVYSLTLSLALNTAGDAYRAVKSLMDAATAAAKTAADDLAKLIDTMITNAQTTFASTASQITALGNEVGQQLNSALNEAVAKGTEDALTCYNDFRAAANATFTALPANAKSCFQTFRDSVNSVSNSGQNAIVTYLNGVSLVSKQAAKCVNSFSIWNPAPTALCMSEAREPLTTLINDGIQAQSANAQNVVDNFRSCLATTITAANNARNGLFNTFRTCLDV